MAHFLLRYELAADYLDRRAAFRDAHLGLACEAVECGELLLGGAVGDPVESALLLFTDADAAHRFAEVDPYVTQGLVIRWSVAPWATVVGAEAASPVRPAA
ncbi:YciI-like protein [Sphingomonas psychrotolerans]|uniref:YciI-like protein n=1 Tax=Sphingomonas psychrotolerans TaxID=1327635 RepID=A0ABU3N8J1_9SPHN|nr:YciI-like protein [Sphingomonas psychrotolerans]MDT8760788.1 YciI-like protein [Sphingomonas psychrotolerans]